MTIAPHYFDTALVNSSNPMCMLVAVSALCDTSMFMSPYSPNFPIQFIFERNIATQHCRHYNMNQITCGYGRYCPDKIVCNLKMNGSRKFKDWSWDCNSPHGKVYYETCYGNKDTTCINVGSFHFRHNNAFKPIKINTKMIVYPPTKTSFIDIIKNSIIMGVQFMIILLCGCATAYIFSGLIEAFIECFPIFITGLLFFSIFGSSDDDSGWYETAGECDD